MNVELTSMLWGGISGAAVFALGLYWLWDMKPDNAETEWLRSDVKDIRNDLHAMAGRCRALEDRMNAIEHPPFEPKFGDRIMAERVDRSGMWPVVYLFTRDKLHRVVALKDGGECIEYFTDTIGPLDD